MSEAMDYLLKIRPELMGQYFSFIKTSGEHLDEKTKFIISVITKVDRQTDKGFRQYLKRALKSGISANELIDALFVAFPTLGLSKIIWATEIILEMDLDEFEPDNMKKESDWREVMNFVDIPSEELLELNIQSLNLLVYRQGEKVKIYDARCPHQATLLTKNDCKGLEIQCSKHKWKFNIWNSFVL